MTTTPSFCPECGTAWPDRLIMSAQSCKTCRNEREKRVSVWLGDTPKTSTSKQASPKVAPSKQAPRLGPTPPRSLLDLHDDLADAGICLMLDGDKLSAKTRDGQPPPGALMAEMKARRPLLLLMMRTFQRIDAFADTLDLENSNDREVMRWETLTLALEDIGEWTEAHAARRRADVLRSRIETT